MNEKPVTPQQLEFCRQVSLGKNYTHAYLAAYHGASNKTAQSNGYLLARRPQLKQKINEFREINGTIIKETKQFVQPGSEQDILERKDRMMLLSNLATGKIIRKKAVVVKGIIEYVEVQAGYNDSLKAIAELNRMDIAEQNKPPQIVHGLRRIILRAASLGDKPEEEINGVVKGDKILPMYGD